VHIQQIEEARALAPIVGHNIAAFDTSPAIVVQYVPNLGVGSEGKMKITTDGLRFKVDDATPTGSDLLSNMNASGWLKFATRTNMGQIVDDINGSVGWRAYLVAALRGDLASNLLAASETSVNGDNGFTFYWDMKAETLISCGIAVSGNKFINNGTNGHVKDDDDECENSILYIEANLADSDCVLRFYSSSDSADTQIGGSLTFTAAGTATYWGKNNPDDIYIRANRGERLIARITTDTQLKATPTRFHVLGKTAVLRNDRVVDSVNY
jgi:hypothetical protein